MYIFWASLQNKITKNVLDAAVKLQAIGVLHRGKPGGSRTRYEKRHYCFQCALFNTRSVAELVIGASIMLIRRIPDKNKAAHEGLWMKEAKGSYELRGKTLGIIGYGNIAHR